MSTLHPSPNAETNLALESSLQTPLPKVYTTGQIAKLLGWSPRTVAKCIDSGRLKGYRLPTSRANGNGDRRVPREHLKTFVQEQGIPVPELFPQEIHLHDAVSANSEGIFCNDVVTLGQIVGKGQPISKMHIDPDLFASDQLAGLSPEEKEQRIRAMVAEATGRAGIACPEIVFVESRASGSAEAA